MAKRVAPFPWFGGKASLADTLVSLIPPHDTYVEAFGGAASLLFAKAPSKLEVYNDLDSGLVNFFRVLRNREQADELRYQLDLTPYSREEWQACREIIRRGDAADLIEYARCWFVCMHQAFAGRVDDGCGWRFATQPSHNPAQSYRSAIALLPSFVARLSEVIVEHKEALQVLRQFDRPGTLYYLDPPYLPETRKAHGYRHEMTYAQHAQFLDTVTHLQAMVILSGYDAPLYQDALAGWQCVRRNTTCSAAGRTRAAGLQGWGSVKSKQKRTECIWLSPNATAHQPMLPFAAESCEEARG